MPEPKKADEHTVLVRIGDARGRRMGMGEWAAFKEANRLARNPSVPQQITTHRTRSAETILTYWYADDGTRVVTRETFAI